MLLVVGARQCDCFYQEHRYLVSTIGYFFEAVYYYNAVYNFNLTYFFYSKMIHGGHVPFKWKSDFVSPVDDGNVPDAPLTVLTPTAFTERLLQDMGQFDDVIINIDGLWGPSPIGVPASMTLEEYSRPFEALVKNGSGPGAGPARKPILTTTTFICFGDARSTVHELRNNEPNKYEIETARAAALGWRVFDKADIHRRMYDSFKRRGWPNLDIYTAGTDDTTVCVCVCVCMCAGVRVCECVCMCVSGCNRVTMY
jgi:hypothetical protein